MGHLFSGNQNRRWPYAGADVDGVALGNGGSGDDRFGLGRQDAAAKGCAGVGVLFCVGIFRQQPAVLSDQLGRRGY